MSASPAPLRDRLRRLGALGQAVAAGRQGVGTAAPGGPLGLVGPPPVGAPVLVGSGAAPPFDFLPSRMRILSAGPALIAEAVRPLDRPHGLADLTRLGRDTAARLVPLTGAAGLEELDWSEVAFVDTETSGISGGVGTYAFLVGVGYVRDTELKVRQFFLADYAREDALLAQLAEFLTGFRGLISFNGKSFDLPVLAARYRLARHPSPFEHFHVDLLHVSRRYWRYRLDGCSLSALEAEILGHVREEDVPSALIPDLYFQYLQDGDPRPLRPVFSHNLEDILSLAALTAHLCGVLEAGPQAPEEELALADQALRRGQLEEAGARYGRVLETCRQGRLRRRALECLAVVCRRQGRWDEARGCWEELAAQELAVEPHVELAKLFEHRRRNPERALHEVLAVQAKLLARPWLGGARRGRWLAALAHRRRRLERKLESLRRHPGQVSAMTPGHVP